MKDVTVSVDVAAPPEAVWRVLADVDRLHEWLTVHDAFAGEPDPVATGAEMTQEVSSGPVSATVEWRLERVVPERELVWVGSATGGARIRTTYALTAIDAGTRIDCASEFTLPGGPLGALAARIAEPRGRAEATESLDRLRALVEE